MDGVAIRPTLYEMCQRLADFGPLHGWTMADLPVYKREAAERHFDELAEFAWRGLESLVIARWVCERTVPVVNE